MKWFLEVFLPSLHSIATQYHGKTVTFLTEKQADICRRYMTAKECHGFYGDFVIFEGFFNDKKIQLCEAGKYDILYW